MLEIIIRYKGLITGVSGVGAVVMMILYIMSFLKLGETGNVQSRRQTLRRTLLTGLATVSLGAFSIILGIFY